MDGSGRGGADFAPAGIPGWSWMRLCRMRNWISCGGGFEYGSVFSLNEITRSVGTSCIAHPLRRSPVRPIEGASKACRVHAVTGRVLRLGPGSRTRHPWLRSRGARCGDRTVRRGPLPSGGRVTPVDPGGSRLLRARFDRRGRPGRRWRFRSHRQLQSESEDPHWGG